MLQGLFRRASGLVVTLNFYFQIAINGSVYHAIFFEGMFLDLNHFCTWIETWHTRVVIKNIHRPLIINIIISSQLNLQKERERDTYTTKPDFWPRKITKSDNMEACSFLPSDKLEMLAKMKNQSVPTSTTVGRIDHAHFSGAKRRECPCWSLL